MVAEVGVAVPKFLKVTEGVTLTVEIVPLGAMMPAIPASTVVGVALLSGEDQIPRPKVPARITLVG